MKLRTALWPLGLSLLAACAATSTVGGAEARAAQARVTGSVTYLQRVALPPGAVIKVQLLEVSRADAAALVLGEQLIQAEGRQAPFAFAIVYDAARIDPRMSYAVGARIEDGGRLLFINDQRYAVLTRGAPTHVDMVLRAVGAARP
jgi:putative lipoprotein